MEKLSFDNIMQGILLLHEQLLDEKRYNYFDDDKALQLRKSRNQLINMLELKDKYK